MMGECRQSYQPHRSPVEKDELVGSHGADLSYFRLHLLVVALVKLVIAGQHEDSLPSFRMLLIMTLVGQTQQETFVVLPHVRVADVAQQRQVGGGHRHLRQLAVPHLQMDIRQDLHTEGRQQRTLVLAHNKISINSFLFSLTHQT